jgi:hypothetical protein
MTTGLDALRGAMGGKRGVEVYIVGGEVEVEVVAEAEAEVDVDVEVEVGA